MASDPPKGPARPEIQNRQWFRDLESKLGTIITEPPQGLPSPLREVCETLSIAVRECTFAFGSLPYLDYKVPDFLLERVCVSVENARQAYLGAECALLTAPTPNVARELLDYALNQLEFLRTNPMGLYVHRERFALHDPIGRLRKFCVRASLVQHPASGGSNRSAENGRNPQATADKSKELESIRLEIVALHAYGTSRKADGETVQKIKSDKDLLDRIKKIGKRIDDESLAKYLHSCLQTKKAIRGTY